MKDLLELVRQCQLELAPLRIPWGRVRNWSVNTRAKARWGLCTKVGRGVFDIQVSASLLEDSLGDQPAKDTIVHELLHTVPGCFKHTGKWKRYAETVNFLLPQYNIKTRSSCEDKGLEDTRPDPECCYLLKCLQCGAEIKRQKKSAVVEHLEHYRCKCGGRLTRITNQMRGGDCNEKTG